MGGITLTEDWMTRFEDWATGIALTEDWGATGKRTDRKTRDWDWEGDRLLYYAV